MGLNRCYFFPPSLWNQQIYNRLHQGRRILPTAARNPIFRPSRMCSNQSRTEKSNRAHVKFYGKRSHLFTSTTNSRPRRCPQFLVCTQSDSLSVQKKKRLSIKQKMGKTIIMVPLISPRWLLAAPHGNDICDVNYGKMDVIPTVGKIHIFVLMSFYVESVRIHTRY